MHSHTYLIIGNGRVAKHVACYFAQLNIPYLHWHRPQSLTLLQGHLEKATHVLLLISDSAIESFAQKYLDGHSGRHIHFSGSLTSDKVIGLHPLQTFNAHTYHFEEYQAIPFVIDHDAPPFSECLPGLNNVHVRLQKSQKQKYHALCVLSGNFSCLLWQKLFSSLENEFAIPKEIAHQYLKQQMQNLLENPEAALTGPLVRNDIAVINQHRQALVSDPFAEVYESFIACYKKIKMRALLSG